MQNEEKGVPNFWLTAMKNNSLLAQEVSYLSVIFFFSCCHYQGFAFLKTFFSNIPWNQITKADEEALKYLIDIKSSRLVCCPEFKLEFFFGPNPYFKNYVLAKKFIMIDEVKLIFDEAIG